MKSISISTDKSNIFIVSDFNSVDGKLEKTKGALLSADARACIYRYRMNEKSAGLMSTFISGCWERGDKMEIEIQLKNSPSFYGVILNKGSKETLFEMENPPVLETTVDDAVPTPDL